MSKSGPTNAQARKLLRTLCKFVIPLAQSLDMNAIKSESGFNYQLLLALNVILDIDDIPLGVEADEFVSELENFLSSAQHKKTDQSLEVTLGTDRSKGTKERSSLWETQPQATSVNFKGNFANQAKDVVLYKQPPDKDSQLQRDLAVLQYRITEYMPMRVLHFEAFGPKLKISFFDRNAMYRHLSEKLQSDYFKPGYHEHKWYITHCAYAILSHTWKQVPGELTYVDWQNGPLDSEAPKCRKLVDFCKIAWQNHGLTLGWIDTVCINKESSSELDESIRSMYKWYSNAKVCITYLAETNSLADMPHDSWFTRGWTFQELVAPTIIKFYDRHWEPLLPWESNDKKHPVLLRVIQSATDITPDELSYMKAVSISRRMELAAARKVTREEDIAYSLMGIFNVSMSTAYGEGRKRAFFRLLKEIFDTYKNATDIFNWGAYSVPSSTTSLFPQDIYHYTFRSTDPNLRPWRPIEPLTLTHLGLRTPVLLMSATFSAELDSGQQPVGDYHANVSVQVAWRSQQIRYHLLQTRDLTYAMGVLNVQEYADGNSIGIPKTCFAVLLRRVTERPNSPGRYKKIATSRPIVFTLEETGRADTDSGNYNIVEKDRLWDHGTKLVTLYL